LTENLIEFIQLIMGLGVGNDDVITTNIFFITTPESAMLYCTSCYIKYTIIKSLISKSLTINLFV